MRRACFAPVRSSGRAGANAGFTQDVRDHRGADGSDNRALAAPPQRSRRATVSTVTAGCDKRFRDLPRRFANAANFRGFPHMPGNDRLMRVCPRRRAEHGRREPVPMSDRTRATIVAEARRWIGTPYAHQASLGMSAATASASCAASGARRIGAEPERRARRMRPQWPLAARGEPLLAAAQRHLRRSRRVAPTPATSCCSAGASAWPPRISAFWRATPCSCMR